MILALLLTLQTTPVAPIVMGNGLPPPQSEEGQVMAPIEAMLAALGREDGAALLALVRPEGGATVASESADGARSVRRFTWAEFAAQLKPGPDRFEESLGAPAIETDGDIAMVWAPYIGRLNGKVVHCGYNHFDLVRENARWRILNITWSQRTTGCEAG